MQSAFEGNKKDYSEEKYMPCNHKTLIFFVNSNWI